MLVSVADMLWDLPIALGLFALIAAVVFLTRRMGNVWVNRKFIHMSSAPAAVVYMYVFREPVVFFTFAVIFILFLILPHLRSRELSWFQVKNNFGEVFYCVSFAALSLALWDFSRILAGVSMLFMAVGDSITGMIRSRFVSKRQKHWTGTLGMLVACLAIGFPMLGIKGAVLAVVATLSEYQPWMDDNLSVPLLTALSGSALMV